MYFLPPFLTKKKSLHRDAFGVSSVTYPKYRKALSQKKSKFYFLEGGEKIAEYS
jgi:hypothetical protein